jgi:internalin A
VYKLLNAKKVAEQRGEVTLSDLSFILPSKTYPSMKHLFLLELMKKFSLCFSFPNDSDRYLMPELLSKEEPKVITDFDPGICLNFEYHYGVFPEGIIPRFIVRCHIPSSQLPRWRSGVVLEYEHSRALVIANSDERKIVIRVQSEDANSRRRLLAIIRYDIERINAEFRHRLDVQERVPLPFDHTLSVDYRQLLTFEKKGVKKFPEAIGDDIVEVNVSDLLSGVDLPVEKHKPGRLVSLGLSVFFSYSHKDEALRDRLEVHLKLLQRQRLISTWHGRKIMPGREWDGEIDANLKSASLIMLLVSADFIASDYVWEQEVKVALERHETGEAIVVPIMLKPCDWETAPFAKLQGLPRGMRPVSDFVDIEEGWTEVAKGVRKVVEGALAQSRAS